MFRSFVSLSMFIVLAVFSPRLLFSTEIKFATLAPKSSSWGRCLTSIKRDMYFKTDKKVKIKVYWGGQHGDEEEIARKIEFGQLDGGAFTGNGLGRVCEEARVLEIPFLFKNKKQVDYVYEKMESVLEPYFKKRGFVLVGLSETGDAYFFSKKEINDFSQIAKTKMWMWKGDKLASVFMRRLGIPAIPVNFTEVGPSLQTGLIDGYYCTPTAAVALQWHKEIKTMMNLPMVNVSGGLVFSTKGWSKLSKSEQALLKQVSKKHVSVLEASNRRSDGEMISLMKRDGIKISSFRGDRSKLLEIRKKVSQDLVGKMFPQKLLDQLMKFYQESDGS